MSNQSNQSNKITRLEFFELVERLKPLAERIDKDLAANVPLVKLEEEFQLSPGTFRDVLDALKIKWRKGERPTPSVVNPELEQRLQQIEMRLTALEKPLYVLDEPTAQQTPAAPTTLL